MGWFGMLVVLVGLALGTDATSEGAARKEWKQLQGAWKMVSWEQEGRQDPGGVLAKLEPWIIKADQITLYEVPGIGLTSTYKVSAADGRQQIDIITVDGRVVRGIYAADGKSLRLCLSYPESGHRPTEFAAKQGSEQVYYIFKRARP